MAIVHDCHVYQQTPQFHALHCLEGMDPISESSTARVSGDTLHYDVMEKDIFHRDVYGSDQFAPAAGSLRPVQPPELLVESVRALGHNVRFSCTTWENQRKQLKPLITVDREICQNNLPNRRSPSTLNSHPHIRLSRWLEEMISIF